MTEHKYTDEEVIKALECCAHADCMNCPRWSEEWTSGMCADFLSDVLDIINRQRAEIERQNDIIGKISEAMAGILLVEYDRQPIPRKNTSRNDVYRACYQIQEILWQIRSKEIELCLVQLRRQNTAATDTNVGGKSEDEQK